MLLLLLRYPFLSTVNFYVHCPEWYSGTPKDDLAPRHWFSAAGSPKTLVAFWGAFRRWFAESPQSVAPRYTCRVSLAPPPQIVNCFSPSRSHCWRAYMLSVLSLSFPLSLCARGVVRAQMLLDYVVSVVDISFLSTVNCRTRALRVIVRANAR